MVFLAAGLAAFFAGAVFFAVADFFAGAAFFTGAVFLTGAAFFTAVRDGAAATLAGTGLAATFLAGADFLAAVFFRSNEGVEHIHQVSLSYLPFFLINAITNVLAFNVSFNQTGCF